MSCGAGVCVCVCVGVCVCVLLCFFLLCSCVYMCCLSVGWCGGGLYEVVEMCVVL